jgi:hypothetical protein
MSVATGFDVIIKIVTGATCTCTNDQISIATGTCTKIPYLDSYSMAPSRAMIDTTGFGDKITKVIPGIPSYTLDFGGGLDLTDSTQLALWNGFSCTTPASRTLRIYDGGKKITVKGYLTGSQIGSSPTGKSTFTANLSMTHLPKTT